MLSAGAGKTRSPRLVVRGIPGQNHTPPSKATRVRGNWAESGDGLRRSATISIGHLSRCSEKMPPGRISPGGFALRQRPIALTSTAMLAIYRWIFPRQENGTKIEHPDRYRPQDGLRG